MNKKRMMKRLLGGGVALALSVAMVVGIFAGTGMDAKAADTWRVEPYTYTPENLSFNDLCIECSGDFSTEEQIMKAILFASEQMATHEGDWMVLVSYTAGVVTAATSNYRLVQCTSTTYF